MNTGKVTESGEKRSWIDLRFVEELKSHTIEAVTATAAVHFLRSIELVFSAESNDERPNAFK